MHLPHSLTVSNICPPSVIYDFLSFNAMILLGILRGRLARNSRMKYIVIYIVNRVISLSLSLSLTLEIVFNCCLRVIYDYFFLFVLYCHIPHLVFLCPLSRILYPTFHISRTSHSISHVVYCIFHTSHPMFDTLTLTFR